MECVLKTSDLCLLSTVIGLHCSIYIIYLPTCTVHSIPNLSLFTQRPRIIWKAEPCLPICIFA